MLFCFGSFGGYRRVLSLTTPFLNYEFLIGVAFGRDNQNSKIMVVFTVRDKLIRVISARAMTKKEKKFYENNKNNPYL